MKNKIAVLFAGFALLTAVPAKAEHAVWQPSFEQTPTTQTTEFEAQDVGFRRGGFRRSGFRRGGFRRGGFRRGFRRGGFKKGGFRSSFGHRFGRRRFTRGHFGFRRGGFHQGGFFKHGVSNFGRFKHLERDHHFSEDHDFKSSEVLNEALDQPSLELDQNETQTQDAETLTPRSAEIISGSSDNSSLFTEGIAEESPEEFLGVELNPISVPDQN